MHDCLILTVVCPVQEFRLRSGRFKFAFRHIAVHRADQKGDEDTTSHSDGAPRWLQAPEDRLGELAADDKL